MKEKSRSPEPKQIIPQLKEMPSCNWARVFYLNSQLDNHVVEFCTEQQDQLSHVCKIYRESSNLQEILNEKSD